MTGAGWVTLGPRGSGIGQFRGPESIFTDDAGRIYIADSGNNRIVRVNDMTGAGWVTLESGSSAADRLDDPAGLFIDPEGRIYISNRGNDHIVRVDDMTGARSEERRVGKECRTR